MRLCFDLVEGGYITAAQALSVLDQHLASRTPIGQLAVESEHMTMSQVFDVLAQQTISNRPFGELAIELGYLDRLDLGRLLLTQVEGSKPLTELILEEGLMTQIELDNAVHERKLQRSRKPANNRPEVLPMAGSETQASAGT
jgi:hypothetical protein